MGLKKVILGVILGIVVLGFGGCALTLFTAGKAVDSVDKAIKEETKKSDDKDALLKVIFDKAKPVEKKDDFSYTVELTVTNDTKENFDYIEVQYDIFDANGVKLGNNFSNISNVTAGQTFKITLDLFQEEAASYKITSVSSSPLK
jgi:hypothetical protein